jgi:hypothetical protein
LIRVYKDSKFISTISVSGTYQIPSDIYLGMVYTGGGFNGIIDEVRVYNRALTEQEIKASYNIGSIIKPGTTATMKIFNTFSKGTHTVRVCTPSMCRIGYLTIV